MKIKRILAENTKQGIRKVKEMLGADAYILSNKIVHNGVEIIAAAGYDEAIIDRFESHENRMPFIATREYSPSTVAATQSQAVKPVVTALDRNKSRINNKAKVLFIKKTNEAKMLQDKLRANFDIIRKQKNLINKQSKIIKISAVEKQKRAKIINLETRLKNIQKPMMNNVYKEIDELKSIVLSQFKNMDLNNWVSQNPGKVSLLRKLTNTGLDSGFSKSIVRYVDSNIDAESAWRKALWLWTKKLPIKNDLIDAGGVVALIGATGVGKTTTIAKLAAYYSKLYTTKDIAIISCDHGGQGSHDRIIAYGRMMGVSVLTTSDTSDLKDIIAGLSKKKLILLDTAGAGLMHAKIADNFSKVFNNIPNLSIHLAVSASSQVENLNDMIKAYGKVKLTSCIITKLDEASSIGGVLSVVARNRFPISYTTTGQNVPGNLEQAYPHRLISKAVALSKRHSQRQFSIAAEESLKKINNKVAI